MLKDISFPLESVGERSPTSWFKHILFITRHDKRIGFVMNKICLNQLVGEHSPTIASY